MSQLFLREKVYPKIAQWVGTLVCVAVVAERASSYAQSQSASPVPAATATVSATATDAATVTATVTATVAPATPESLRKDQIDLGVLSPDEDDDSPEKIRENQIPLSEKNLRKFDTIRTKEQICKLIEHKILTYYDTVSLVENCVQRPIEDPVLFNDLVMLKKTEVVEVPGRLYKLIPFGKPLTREYVTGVKPKSKPTSQECGEVEGHYVTATGTTYYFIENCKKRAFEQFYDLQEHNVGKKTITSLDPELLERIPAGKPFPTKENDTDSLLMKMDGDVKWSLLARANRQGEFPRDNIESLRAIEKQGKNNKTQLCQKFDGRLVSFYTQIFLLQKCQLRKVTDFTVKLQQVISKSEAILDLTSEEYRSLVQGNPIETKDLLAYLRARSTPPAN
jgi:hypothetical protein